MMSRELRASIVVAGLVLASSTAFAAAQMMTGEVKSIDAPKHHLVLLVRGDLRPGERHRRDEAQARRKGLGHVRHEGRENARVEGRRRELVSEDCALRFARARVLEILGWPALEGKDGSFVIASRAERIEDRHRCWLLVIASLLAMVCAVLVHYEVLRALSFLTPRLRHSAAAEELSWWLSPPSWLTWARSPSMPARSGSSVLRHGRRGPRARSAA